MSNNWSNVARNRVFISSVVSFLQLAYFFLLDVF